MSEDIPLSLATLEIPKNHVFSINTDSPQEAKDVRNALREALVPDIVALLVEAGVTFGDRFIHIKSKSTLNEIDTFAKKVKMNISNPDTSMYPDEPSLKFVYIDPRTNDLNFGTREEIDKMKEDLS